jgi:hypothetical protein
MKGGAWIKNPLFDSIFMISPSFISVLIVLLFSLFGKLTQETGPFSWLILIVFIDVGHVWSTLYRTYLNPEAFAIHRGLYLFIPFFCWIVGAMLYSLRPLYFWRVLAYLAVYHFVRQQYGIFMIYCRHESNGVIKRRIAKSLIYAATLVPLLHWHVRYPLGFNWFVHNEFISLPFYWLEWSGWIIYFILIVVYLFFEIRSGILNIPKNLFLLGTLLSWFIGIVLLKGDLSFTITNVLAHGIPYMALIWHSSARPLVLPYKIWNGKGKVILFLFIILLFAYFEEGLWDVLIWRDHLFLFPGLNELEAISNGNILVWLMPLLSLPQSTHYLLDGFIWKSDHKVPKAIF